MSERDEEPVGWIRDAGRIHIITNNNPYTHEFPNFGTLRPSIAQTAECACGGSWLLTKIELRGYEKREVRYSAIQSDRFGREDRLDSDWTVSVSEAP